jgi:hypothetical protein
MYIVVFDLRKIKDKNILNDSRLCLYIPTYVLDAKYIEEIKNASIRLLIKIELLY